MRTLRKKIEVDDNAVMILDFGPKAKCLGYIEVGWTSKAGFSGIEVSGDNGCITLDLVNGPKITRGVVNPDGTREVRTEAIEVHEGAVPLARADGRLGRIMCWAGRRW